MFENVDKLLFCDCVPNRYKWVLPNSKDDLYLVTAGIRPPDPINLLSSKRMREVNSLFLEKDFDYIIYDAPPSLGLSDAKILGEFCDSMFFII